MCTQAMCTGTPDSASPAETPNEPPTPRVGAAGTMAAAEAPAAPASALLQSPPSDLERGLRRSPKFLPCRQASNGC